MFKVQVSKADLLKTLNTNRAQHRDTFLRAQTRFRERAIEEFEARLKRARDGDKIELYVQLPVPEDHSDEYDRAIAMLKMSTDDTIELNEQDYAQYVEDEWGWKRAWAGTNATYGLDS